MFSPFLYDHKFDIDDLIAALLGGESLFLETRTGKLSAARPEVDDAHCFKLEPLSADWLQSLEGHEELRHLEEIERQELGQLIESGRKKGDAYPGLRRDDGGGLLDIVQGSTRLGGWLRERVKDEAMQWLADNDLIPPSMRHINGVPKARAAAAPKGVKKVNILPE